jgi:hypothetical protein
MGHSANRLPALALRVALVVAMAAGCTPQRDKAPRAAPPQGGMKVRAGDSNILKGKPVPPKPGDLSDSCAQRMHDLGGLLLLYYAVNKALPENREDMASLADMDVEFHGECPVSGKPYAYVPHAVPPGGSEQFLVLYDSVPAHNGLRWGVFITPPKDGQPAATRAILMSEDVFRRYAPQQPAR